jgi:hypothetical protein
MQMCSDQKGKKGKSQAANLTRKNFFEHNMSHYKKGWGKVKFCLSTPRRHTRGAKVQLHSFLTSALDKGDW